MAAAALVLAPAPASANQYWVGNLGFPPCTHATLQQAIDAAQFNAGNDTIFLVGTGTFTGPFSILGGGIQIVGGVASCGSTTSTGYATLRAPSGKRPLTILMGEAGIVSLRRLKITTQLGTYNGDGGGIWFAGAGNQSELDLDDSQVFNNGSLGDGGGIFVSNGVVLLTGGALVYANTAVNGGGIAGVNGAFILLIKGNVTANTATFDGGGIYAPDTAVSIISLVPGGSCAVANNIAGGDGGGIYTSTPETSLVTSTLDSGVTAITGNQARRGGGLFLDGAQMTLERAEVNLNLASEAGGGVYVAAGGILSSNFPAGFPLFTTNQAAQGSALYVDGGAQAILKSGRFSSHQAGAGGAAVAAVNGFESGIFLQGVTVSGNQAPELFAVTGRASLFLGYSSIAGNTVNRLVRWDGTSPGVGVFGSAFSETEPFFSGLGTPQTLPLLTCSVSHFSSLLQGFPAGTDLSGMLVADPRFVNPKIGDLHLFAVSPAVDRCGEDSSVDFDGQVRNFDDPYRPNAVGWTGDAGADEVLSIFWDDFEAGNAGRWSFTAGIVGANNVQVTPAARLGPPASQFGLQVNLVDPLVQAPTATYVAAGPNRGFSNETALKGSFFIDPQSVTMSTAAGANYFQMIDFLDSVGPGSKVHLIFFLARSPATGDWFINVYHWNQTLGGGAGNWQFSGNGFFALDNDPNWHNNRIDFQWNAGNPGRLTMWRTRYVNGVPDGAGTIQMFSVNLPGMQNAKINYAFAGMFASQFPGTFGTLYLDEFSFQD